jgi:uncharacterized protein
MFSLQVLFGKGEKFFGLLEQSADAAHASSKALLELVKQGPHGPISEQFEVNRRREKELSQAISKDLVDTFVTAIEREDIEALNSALYKIPKTIQKFAERYNGLAKQLKSTHQVDFAERSAMLERAARTVAVMVKDMRGGLKLEPMKAHFDSLQVIEHEADRLINNAYIELFSGQHDALSVVLLKDLYELMEKAIDRCSEAGKVVYQITLKNS